MSTTTGLISGTPTTAATTSVTVSATNAGGTGTLAVAFTISLPPSKVVVAPSGGNYTTIAAAMAAINPSATAPVVIEVWPGVYNIPEAIYPKSYVHIKGSGRDVTIIKPATGQYGFFTSPGSVTNVTISDLTVQGGGIGIYIQASNVAVLDCRVSGSINFGILVEGHLTPSHVVISGNEVSGVYGQGIYLLDAIAEVTNNKVSGSGEGMALFGSWNSIIKGNVITGSNGSGLGYGMRIMNTYGGTESKSIITDNVITDNASYGIYLPDVTTGGTFTNNKIVNNGGALPDIAIDGIDRGFGTTPGNPNFSFNVFDDITGTEGVGSYNVKSNGDPIAVP